MWGALAGAGLSIAGGIAGKRSQNKAISLQRGRQQRVFNNELRPLEALLYGQQEDYLRQAMGAQVGGYDNALADLSRVGRSSRREARDQSQAALSQGLQGMAGSGLGSSTLAGNYRTGAASRLSRDLAGIDENLAGLRSNLTIGRGQAQAKGYGSLADLYGQRRRGERDLSLKRADLLVGQLGGGSTGPPGAMPLDLSGIAQFASLFGDKGGGA